MSASLSTSSPLSSPVSPAPRPRCLRVALLLESYSVPRWIAKTVDDLRQSGFVDLALVALAPSETPHRTWNTFLFDLWSRLDYRWFRKDDDVFAPVDLQSKLGSIPEIRLSPGTSPATPAFVQAYDLDVVLDLTSGGSSSECDAGPGAGNAVTNWARFGVWRLAAGDTAPYLDGPPLFWEIFDRNPVSTMTLRVQRPGAEHPHTIYRSHSATNFNSLYYNRNATYWKASEFLRRRLAELHRDGWNDVPSEALTCAPAAKARSVPGNFDMLRFLARWTVDALNYEFRKEFFKEHWFIAYRRAVSGQLPHESSGDFTVIRPPRDRSYADPFIFAKDGRNFIFFEDYRFASDKALISCVELDGNGRAGAPQPVLEAKYHLSYPNVFEWQGDVFMLPESLGNRTIELYRAVEFPYRWQRERVLIDNISAVDPTIIHHDGKFWLFAGGIVERASTNDELFLYFSESLFGPWTSHPRNPIISDVRRARPAGQIFVHNGQLIRPGQDCSVRYGHSVGLYRIDALSKTEYRETPVGRLLPDWHRGNLGTHTFNQNSAFQVVDGRTLIPK